MNNLRIDIVTKIDEIKESWEKISINEHFTLDYIWYKNNSNVLSDKTYYLYMHKNNNIIAILPIHEISNDIIWNYSNPYRFLNGEIYDNIDCQNFNFIKGEKYLLVNSPFGYHSDLIIDPMYTNNEIIHQKILDGLDTLARQNNIVDIFFLYTDSSKRTFQSLTTNGYVSFPVMSDCLMNTDYNSFEEFLINNKNRRMIRREMKLFKKNLEVQTLTDFKDYTHLFAKLEGDLLKKYHYEEKDIDLEYSENWYKKLNEDYKEDSYAFLAFNKDRNLLGFSLFIKKNGISAAKATGFDYNNLPGNSFCYFNLVYYYPVLYAIENDINEISFGAGSYQAKLERGCSLKKYYLSYKSLDVTRMKQYKVINSILNEKYDKYLNELKIYG